MTNLTRTFDIFQLFKEKPDTIGQFKLGYKKNNQWLHYNVTEYMSYANNFSYGLLALGFKKGDKIITISNNRPEWCFVDMGMAQAGVVHVPVYPTISNEEFEHIFKHSDARIIIVSDTSTFKKVSEIAAKIPSIEYIYTFDTVADAKNWLEIIELGEKSAVYYQKELEETKNTISENDLLTIIYTSGTTGVSKGVMLSHKNLMSNSIAAAERQILNFKHKVLSFLPLSHVFEHMVIYNYQLLGISIYFAENIGTIAADIKELQVDGFITVPRLLETIHERIYAKAKSMSGTKKKIFEWAIKLAFSYQPYNNGRLYKIKHKIADKLVYSKLRAVMSEKIVFIGCGGAALQPKLARFFWAIGLPVYEGYGLSETSPILSVNYPGKDNIRIGTVGPILQDVNIKIADDGEILAKGPNIMLGYYKNQELTDEVIDAEGWFHTGDIGQIIDNRFIKITDRKKEMFKMSNGKYIAPQLIENKLKESFFVSQTMVVGENQKFASAIISPNFVKLKEWCESKKIQFHNYRELIHKPQVIEQFNKEVAKLNKGLGQFEQIKRFRLVSDEWNVHTGELSPTLKLKRRVIYEKYKDILESIYNSVHQPQKVTPVVVKNRPGHEEFHQE